MTVLRYREGRKRNFENESRKITEQVTAVSTCYGACS